MKTILLVLGGIVLPLLAILVEVTTHICADSFFDPLPTVGYIAYYALIPLSTFLTLRALPRYSGDTGTSRSIRPATHQVPRWIPPLNMLAIGVAAVYSVMFLPIVPLSVIGIIAYGLGGLGLSPYLALWTGLALRRTLRMVEVEGGAQALKPWTMLPIALMLYLALDASALATHTLLRLAASPNLETQTRAIQMLRIIPDDSELLRLCYVPLDERFDATVVLGPAPELAVVRNIFYRVKGFSFSAVPPPRLATGRNGWQPDDEFMFDNDQGSDHVGGRIKGLWLTDSSLSGQAEPVGALTYFEWTMEFRNDGYSNREARVEIALPPGAVVSRMTLWMNGSPKEAEFGDRTQTRNAYVHTVQAHRDPSLVTSSGPDAVLLQCFPVLPNGGKMKVRLGITAPWVGASGTSARLWLPFFKERNFNLAPDFAHHIDVPLCMSGSLSDRDLVDHEPFTIPVLAHGVPGEAADKIVVVVDGSAPMAVRLKALSAQLPASAVVLYAGDAIQNVRPADVAHAQSVGGQDDVPALTEALASGTAHTAVVWIHGTQPLILADPAILRTRLDEPDCPRLFDVQVLPGPNRVLERLDGARRLSHYVGPLPELFATLQGLQPVYRIARASSPHSVDLEAFERVRELLHGQVKAASDLAVKSHLVTPVSSAVVLETTLADAPKDVQPTSQEGISTAPEPPAWLLAMVVLGILTVLRKHAAFARPS